MKQATKTAYVAHISKARNASKSVGIVHMAASGKKLHGSDLRTTKIAGYTGDDIQFITPEEYDEQFGGDEDE